MSGPILKIENLKKTFRSNWTFRPIEAVKGVSLDVFRGESFGFLGHNGAGKTTTIKCIVGLIHKTEGKIYLNGEEFSSNEQHRLLGYLPEHPYFYDHLSVEETLDFFAQLHDIDKDKRKIRIEEVLELVGLPGRNKSKVRSLSKGMQQRLGFAQAIINKPQLLLLDEPFSGLDPIGRLELRELILKLKAEGTTIFMSSHILSDVEDICDRVSIMAHGEMKTVFDLKEAPEIFGEAYELTISGLAKDSEKGRKIIELAESSEFRATASGEVGTLRYKDYTTGQTALLEAANCGAKVLSFESAGLSLEDIFMNITGRKYLSEEKNEEQAEVTLNGASMQ